MGASGGAGAGAHAVSSAAAEKVTPVRLTRMELRKIRSAARRAGYTVESFLVVSAFKAASDGDVPDGSAAALLEATRDVALRAAALSNRVSGTPDTAEQAEELCAKSLDLCAMAYRAETESRGDTPDAAAGRRTVQRRRRVAPAA